MEFVVTGLEQLPQQIDCNFEALKKELEESLQKYSSIVVTPDSIAAAKKSRADLNKLKTALDERRKEVKREWCKPLDEFESKVKTLSSLIDKPIEVIDKQVKVFDGQRIDEKRASLLECYSSNIGDLNEFITFEKLVDPKWKNVTAELDKLKTDMLERISRCKSDIKIIATTCGKYVAACQQKYYDTLNISDALAEFKKLEELDRRREIAEEEKRKAEERARAVNVQPVSPPPLTMRSPEAPVNTVPAEELKTIDVRFINTTSAFRADMKALCIKHGIEYGNVPKGV